MSHRAAHVCTHRPNKASKKIRQPTHTHTRDVVSPKKLISTSSRPTTKNSQICHYTSPTVNRLPKLAEPVSHPTPRRQSACRRCRKIRETDTDSHTRRQTTPLIARSAQNSQYFSLLPCLLFAFGELHCLRLRGSSSSETQHTHENNKRRRCLWASTCCLQTDPLAPLPP